MCLWKPTIRGCGRLARVPAVQARRRPRRTATGRLISGSPTAHFQAHSQLVFRKTSGLLVSVRKLVRDWAGVVAKPWDRLGVVEGGGVGAGRRPVRSQVSGNHGRCGFHTWRRRAAFTEAPTTTKGASLAKVSMSCSCDASDVCLFWPVFALPRGTTI